MSGLHKLFILNRNLKPVKGLNGNCSRSCSCKSLAFQQCSTLKNFPILNLKGFREEHRVEHLVPNQILFPIERCGIL